MTRTKLDLKRIFFSWMHFRVTLRTNVRRPLIPNQEVSGSGLGLDWLDLW